ncbi:hypothetical protein [Duganella vulcania]|uniref:Uncharacterized protein n=1 Tax=Duganella vulcania TaxID=2692166 RepID=A0A845GSV6_9BURK|nr:hypothetical protein [Duganella vulcania]MYM97583.1 hypothetical protein [Duganella vulcania]
MPASLPPMKLFDTRHARKFILGLLACGLLQGCGVLQQPLMPSAPERAVKTAKEAALALRRQDDKRPLGLDDMKAVTAALRGDIIAAAEQKNLQSWNSGLTTLLGGTMATVGSVTARTGLTNTGIALALLGLSSDQFYKPANAIDIHLDADSKLMCIADATSDLNETNRQLATGSGFTGADEAEKAVETLEGTINSAMLSYRRSLLGLRPGTPTRDDILGMIKRFQADATSGAKGGLPDNSDEQKAKAAAAQKYVGLSTVLQACIKLGAPVAK